MADADDADGDAKARRRRQPEALHDLMTPAAMASTLEAMRFTDDAERRLLAIDAGVRDHLVKLLRPSPRR